MYRPTIGIEVHAELKTATKMFCGCANDPHAAEPNTHVCPVCMAEPGSLPVVNRDAVQKVLMVGAALGSELASFTEFDRKHYFYPDLPKGYQISQYQYPFVKGGELAGVAITRVHLEEDAARSQHEGHDGTLVDYNRAGVPLMELVTEPVVHDIETARRFVSELQLLLKTIGVSDANLEKGEMRLEANISVSKTDALGTKVEVKNLNSFRSLEAAIAYEIERQSDMLDRGERVVQETRGWNEQKMQTFSQRSKEAAAEYRYMPDPDIPKFDVSRIPAFDKSRILQELPETPEKKREKYGNLGLPSNVVEQIVLDIPTAMYMDTLLVHTRDHAHIRIAANYLTTDIPPLLAERGCSLTPNSAPHLAELVALIVDKKITSRVAKDLLPEILFDGISPKKAAEERGLLQEDNADAIRAVVTEIIAENTAVVAEYRAGKEAVLQFLVGQGMKKTRGTANPAILADLLKQGMVS